MHSFRGRSRMPVTGFLKEDMRGWCANMNSSLEQSNLVGKHCKLCSMTITLIHGGVKN